jgi:phosphotransferase system enzyme I (PtsI)
LKGLSEAVREGDLVALDGFRGLVEVHPSLRTLKRLRARRRTFQRLERSHARLVRLPAETNDGQRVSLLANMETPAEADFIEARGAEGVGLFRTEFFFMWRPSAPSEDEQVEAYRKVLDAFHPRPVVIRAMDVGGDKLASYMGMAREQNPFLGLRGIRYLLAHPEVFRTQLQAILRAGAGRRARILLPMIHCVREVHDTREILDRAMSSLRRRRVPFDPHPELGVMIEVPSAVLMAEELAREADFLSVGSNDLIQYLLAIDRDNEALVGLYRPQHPAVLRALAHIVEAARHHGRSISMCGEMASDPLAVPLLLGLGFDRLSVSPFMIPEIKQTVRSLSQAECRSLTEEALRAEDAEAVATLTERRLGSRFSDLLALIREVNGSPGAARHRPGTTPE